MKQRNRIPTDLQDDYKIFCYKERQKNKTFMQIAKILNKDHSTIVYSVKCYEGFEKVDRKFRERIENFNREEFLERFNQYQDNLNNKI